jgi:hypothetical protein
MPFIIDLPPASLKKQITKIEHVQRNIDQKIPEIEYDSVKLDNDLFENFYLQDKFNSLVNLWKENTIFESSISNIIEEENFKKILELDKKAIPFIIDKIDREPSVLVWALNLITGKSMSSSGRETIEQVCKKWVKAYREGKIQNV